VLEFPEDPSVAYLDRQYMLGRDLLVAPVFTEDGSVEFYLPAGVWTNWFTGEQVVGGTWRREVHGFTTLPLYVREGGVVARGSRQDRPDYDYLEGLHLVLGAAGEPREVTVTTPEGRTAAFSVVWENGSVHATGDVDEFTIDLLAGTTAASTDGKAELPL
jgi:alpha-D-xyloside xylohydrolase